MASGYGLESPSPGGARSQGKGLKVNTGLRGLAPCTGFPLNFRTPPLLGASRHDTVHHARTQVLTQHLAPGSTARLPGAPALPDSLFYSPAERRLTAAVAVSDVSSLAEVSPPPHLRLVLPPPRASTALLKFPRARTAALDRVASPPRGVEPALPGRRVVPAPAAFLDRSRLAPPLRRLLLKLGEAWPSLSKITVVRLPLRRAFPR